MEIIAKLTFCSRKFKMKRKYFCYSRVIVMRQKKSKFTSASSISFMTSLISFPPKSSVSLSSFCSHVPSKSKIYSSEVGDN